ARCVSYCFQGPSGRLLPSAFTRRTDSPAASAASAALRMSRGGVVAPASVIGGLLGVLRAELDPDAAQRPERVAEGGRVGATVDRTGRERRPVRAPAELQPSVDLALRDPSSLRAGCRGECLPPVRISTCRQQGDPLAAGADVLHERLDPWADLAAVG